MDTTDKVTLLIALLAVSALVGSLTMQVSDLKKENLYLKNNQIIINTVQTLMTEDIKPCDL